MCDHCGCREFEPIAELSAEHEQILDVAWRLSEQLRRTGSGDGPLRDRLRAMLEIHVDAEESALYPLLADCGDLDARRRSTLEDEHRQLAATLAGGRFDRRAYFELAAHIEEEELELFPMAMFAFDDEDWAALGATARFSADVLGG